MPATETDWHELALMSREQGDLQQALYCYDKAIRTGPHDNVGTVCVCVCVCGGLGGKRVKRELGDSRDLTLI